MSGGKIYCEPDNCFDLTLHSNPVSFKFNQTGIDVSTLNLIGWLMKGLPYRKIRTLVTCGVYYKYQVEFGPYAALNIQSGLLRHILNGQGSDDENSRYVEILPTGDSATDEPKGYESYLERHGSPSGMRRAFIAFCNVHTGHPLADGVVPSKTREGQWIDKCYFDPETSNCSEKTMLVFKTLLDSFKNLKTKWQNSIIHSGSGRNIGSMFLCAGGGENEKKLILTEERYNLAGLGLEYLPRDLVEKEHKDIFSRHLITTGVKMLKCEYREQFDSFWYVFDCDQTSLFDFGEPFDKMKNYFIGVGKKQEIVALFKDIVEKRINMAFPIPFYSDGVILFWGLILVITMPNLPESIFILITPSKYKDSEYTTKIKVVVDNIYTKMITTALNTDDLNWIKIRKSNMQDEINESDSDVWVLVILEALMLFLSGKKTLPDMETLQHNGFPRKFKEFTNMYLPSSSDVVVRVRKNVTKIFRKSVEVAEHIKKHMAVMEQKAVYVPPVPLISKGVDSSLKVCSFYSSLEIQTAVSEIEKIDTSVPTERQPAASDVHSIVIAGIDEDENGRVDVKFADGEEIRGRYTRELVQGHRGVLTFFKELPSRPGAQPKYLVLTRVKIQGSGNMMCWVVMKYSDTGTNFSLKKPIYLASTPFMRTEKNDFVSFGKSSAWFSCTSQTYRQNIEPIHGKNWMKLKNASFRAFDNKNNPVDLEKLASMASPSAPQTARSAVPATSDKKTMEEINRIIRELRTKNVRDKWWYYMTEREDTVLRVASNRLDVGALTKHRASFQSGKETWILDKGKYTGYTSHADGAMIEGVIKEKPCKDYNEFVNNTLNPKIFDEFYIGSKYNSGNQEQLLNRYKFWFFQAVSKQPNHLSEVQNYLWCVWFSLQTYVQNKQNLPFYQLLWIHNRVQYLLGWYALKFKHPVDLREYILEWLSISQNTQDISVEDVISTTELLKGRVSKLTLTHKRVIATALNLNIYEFFPDKDFSITGECSAFEISHGLISKPLLKFTAPVTWIPDTRDVVSGIIPEIKTVEGKAFDADQETMNVQCVCMQLDSDLNGQNMSVGKGAGFFKALSAYSAFGGDENSARGKFTDCMKSVFLRHLAVLKGTGRYNPDSDFNPYYTAQGETGVLDDLSDEELSNVVNVKFELAIQEILRYHERGNMLSMLFESWFNKNLVLNLDIVKDDRLAFVMTLLKREEGEYIWASIPATTWQIQLKNIIDNLDNEVKDSLTRGKLNHDNLRNIQNMMQIYSLIMRRAGVSWNPIHIDLILVVATLVVKALTTATHIIPSILCEWLNNLFDDNDQQRLMLECIEHRNLMDALERMKEEMKNRGDTESETLNRRIGDNKPENLIKETMSRIFNPREQRPGDVLPHTEASFDDFKWNKYGREILSDHENQDEIGIYQNLSIYYKWFVYMVYVQSESFLPSPTELQICAGMWDTRITVFNDFQSHYAIAVPPVRIKEDFCIKDHLKNTPSRARLPWIFGKSVSKHMVLMLSYDNRTCRVMSNTKYSVDIGKILGSFSITDSKLSKFPVFFEDVHSNDWGGLLWALNTGIKNSDNVYATDRLIYHLQRADDRKKIAFMDALTSREQWRNEKDQSGAVKHLSRDEVGRERFLEMFDSFFYRHDGNDSPGIFQVSAEHGDTKLSTVLTEMATVCEKRIVLLSFRYLNGCDELLDGGFSSWTVFGRDMFKLEIPTVMFFRKTDSKFEFKPAVFGQHFPNTVFIFKLDWDYSVIKMADTATVSDTDSFIESVLEGKARVEWAEHRQERMDFYHEWFGREKRKQGSGEWRTRGTDGMDWADMSDYEESHDQSDNESNEGWGEKRGHDGGYEVPGDGVDGGDQENHGFDMDENTFVPVKTREDKMKERYMRKVQADAVRKAEEEKRNKEFESELKRMVEEHRKKTKRDVTKADEDNFKRVIRKKEEDRRRAAALDSDDKKMIEQRRRMAELKKKDNEKIKNDIDIEVKRLIYERQRQTGKVVSRAEAEDLKKHVTIERRRLNAGNNTGGLQCDFSHFCPERFLGMDFHLSEYTKKDIMQPIDIFVLNVSEILNSLTFSLGIDQQPILSSFNSLHDNTQPIYRPLTASCFKGFTVSKINWKETPNFFNMYFDQSNKASVDVGDPVYHKKRFSGVVYDIGILPRENYDGNSRVKLNTSMNGFMQALKLCLVEALRNAEHENIKTSKSCFSSISQIQFFKKYMKNSNRSFLKVFDPPNNRSSQAKRKQITWKGLLNPDNINPGVMKIFIDYYYSVKDMKSPDGREKSFNTEFRDLMSDAMNNWPKLCNCSWGEINEGSNLSYALLSGEELDKALDRDVRLIEFIYHLDICPVYPFGEANLNSLVEHRDKFGLKRRSIWTDQRNKIFWSEDSIFYHSTEYLQSAGLRYINPIKIMVYQNKNRFDDLSNLWLPVYYHDYVKVPIENRASIDRMTAGEIMRDQKFMKVDGDSDSDSSEEGGSDSDDSSGNRGGRATGGGRAARGGGNNRNNTADHKSDEDSESGSDDSHDSQGGGAARGGRAVPNGAARGGGGAARGGTNNTTRDENDGVDYGSDEGSESGSDDIASASIPVNGNRRDDLRPGDEIRPAAAQPRENNTGGGKQKTKGDGGLTWKDVADSEKPLKPKTVPDTNTNALMPSDKDKSTKKKKEDSGPQDVDIGGANANGCPRFNAWVDAGYDPDSYPSGRGSGNRRGGGRGDRGGNSNFDAKRRRKAREFDDSQRRTRGGGGVGEWNDRRDDGGGNGRGAANGEWQEVRNGRMNNTQRQQHEEYMEHQRRIDEAERSRTGFGEPFDLHNSPLHLGLEVFSKTKSFSHVMQMLDIKSGLKDTKTYAQTYAKEIYFLTASLGQVMAVFSVLKEGGWATFKIHGGQGEESRCIAKIIRPFFEECEIYPISKAYTCHMLLAGTGFRKSRADSMALVSLLHDCASINANSLVHLVSVVRGAGIIKDSEFDEFEKTVELTSQKMFMDWFDHQVAISKASIQATLEGEVDPYAGYLHPEIGNLLNRLVFRHISEEDRACNRKTLQVLLETPFGAQLQPLFIFIGPPPTSLVMPKSDDLATTHGRLEITTA